MEVYRTAGKKWPAKTDPNRTASVDGNVKAASGRGGGIRSIVKEEGRPLVDGSVLDLAQEVYKRMWRCLAVVIIR